MFKVNNKNNTSRRRFGILLLTFNIFHNFFTLSSDSQQINVGWEGI